MLFRRFIRAMAVLSLVWVAAGSYPAQAQDAPPPAAAEEDFLIVKYGSVLVKSSAQGAKVYIDETYKGTANTLIEKVITGSHTISCQLEDKAVSGTFTIRKNETLTLEARFNEGKLVAAGGDREDAERKKKADEASRQEQRKRTDDEAKKPAKSAAEERRDLHVTVFKVDFRDRSSQAVSVSAKADSRIISGYAESRNQSGKYYKTKQGLLLCEAGPCVQEWTAKFYYTDEKNSRDAFMITWKQTVFSGMTPSGTSGREVTWCLNGTCRQANDTDTNDAPKTLELGGYAMTWTKGSVVFRRADIVKEILDAGGSLPD